MFYDENMNISYAEARQKSISFIIIRWNDHKEQQTFNFHSLICENFFPSWKS